MCNTSKIAQNLLITELEKEETACEYLLNGIQLDDKINVYEKQSNVSDDLWFLWEKFYETVDFNNQSYNYFKDKSDAIKKDGFYYTKYKLLTELHSVLSLYEYYLIINPIEIQMAVCYERVNKLYETIITLDATENEDYQINFVIYFKNLFGNPIQFKFAINPYVIMIKEKRLRDEDPDYEGEILAIKSIISAKKITVVALKEKFYSQLTKYNFSYGEGYYEKIKRLSADTSITYDNRVGINKFDYPILNIHKTKLQTFKEGLISKNQTELNAIKDRLDTDNSYIIDNIDINIIKKNISTVQIDNSKDIARVAYNKNNTNTLNYLYPYINYLLETIENLEENYKSMYLLEKTSENIKNIGETDMTETKNLFYEIINDNEASDNIDLRYRKTIDAILKGKSFNKSDIIQIDNTTEIDNIDIYPIGLFRKQSKSAFSLQSSFEITMNSIHIDSDIVTLKLNVNDTSKSYNIVICDYNNMEIYSSKINNSNLTGTLATKFIPISLFTDFKNSCTVYVSDNVSSNVQIYYKCFSFIINELYLKSLSFEYASSETKLVQTTIKLDSSILLYTPDTPVYSNLIPYALTSDTTPSPYVTYSSSILGFTYQPFKAFNYVKGKSSDNYGWHSRTNDYVETIYNDIIDGSKKTIYEAGSRTAITNVEGSNISGEWIEIGNTTTQFDNVKEVVLYGSSVLTNQRFPKRVMVVGSNDRIIWKKIMDSQELLGESIIYTEGTDYITNTQRLLINHTSNYKYLRLIIRQLGGRDYPVLIEVEYKKAQSQAQPQAQAQSQVQAQPQAQTQG